MINKVFGVLSQLVVIPFVFILGRFNCSFGWIVPLMFSSFRTFTKRNREIRQAITHATSSLSERDVILARLQDVPAWVIFPDIERAEWINSILEMFWPKISDLVEKKLQNLEPKIQKISALKSFTFKKVDLGKIVSFPCRNENQCFF
jgi:Synaptotagmin-like mitochondrial-lipid-binding domain